MANTLTGGYGLRPIGKVGSNVNSTGITQYEIKADYATAIFNGAIVVPVTTGTIILTDQAVAPLGVMSGVEYTDSTTKKRTFLNYWPGANSVSVDTNFPVLASIHDDPFQLYVVSADGSNTSRAVAQADVFKNCNLASVNGGSTNTGQSSDMLDISTAATTNTLDLRIVGLYEDPSNEDYAVLGHQYVVRLNGHFNNGNTIAVGTYATTGI